MPVSSKSDLAWLFQPRSIAVIGASADDQKEKTGWVGRLIDFGYKGKLYPINPKADRILGLKAYPSVKDVPDEVDYTIVSVKASLVPQMLWECVSKKVKAVHIFTSGFGEVGTAEGKKLHEEILEAIRAGTTRVIGPNCMGIYCPENGITFNARFAREKGTVGIVSQSGAALLRLIPGANRRGIYGSKVVSYGNAIDLDGPDFLEYLAEDAGTSLVFCYVEGVKDGRRFMEAIRRCMQQKPVVMLKGGLTEGGSGAAASHTASLAGSAQVWRTFFKQTGVIQVDSFEEAIDQMIAVQNLGGMQGRGIAIVARGGGPGVVTADQCELAGLSVPAFSPDIQAQLAKMVEAGSGSRNPVEIGLGRRGLAEGYGEALRIVASDPKISLMLTRIGIESQVQYGVGDEEVEATCRVLIDASKVLPKPLVVVVDAGQTPEAALPAFKAQEKLAQAGLAVFPTIQAAVTAIGKLAHYREFALRRL